MYDPQDLLYTNKFTSDDVLTEKEIGKETEYYDRFKTYIDNNLVDETNKYSKEDQYENDQVNINKRLLKKWPVKNNSNHYPLFDTYINDISNERYKKEIITKINIDSLNRNIYKYPNSNSFSIDLNRMFNNIKKYVINDINFQNTNQSVTNINNNLAWQYSSQSFLVQNNIDTTIIPVPGDIKIKYSSLPNSTFSFATGQTFTSDQIENYLVYQTNISPGFYTIDSLINKIRLSTSSILHGQNVTPEINIFEEPYIAYAKRVGTPHLFTTQIDPISSIVRFVNRIEEVEIAAIQTFSPYENNFPVNDIFYQFSSQYSANNPAPGKGIIQQYSLDTSLIYVILPETNDTTSQYFQNINCIYSSNAFPLVITGLNSSIGNIDPNLINFTEFYDIQIYLKNGYLESQLNSISHYKFIDTITITTQTQKVNYDDINGYSTITTNYTNTYFRFGLRLSNGNLNGSIYNSTIGGKIIVPSITENIVLSHILNNYLINYGNIGNPVNYKIVTNTSNENDTTTNNYPNSIIDVPVNNTVPNTLTTATLTSGVVPYTNYYTSGLIANFKYMPDDFPKIGRALLYRWIFDKNNNNYVNYQFEGNNEKKRSLLNILAWPIANETYDVYTVDTNFGFKFVHTNYQTLLTNQKDVLYLSNIPITSPVLSLNLQYFSNNYYFINNSYIYLKILFNSQISDVKDEYLNASSDVQTQYNQVYINTQLFNVGIGEDYTYLKNCSNINVYKKNQSGLFTKIMLSNIPGNYEIMTSNIINNNSNYVNYDEVANNVSQVSIELYDSEFRLLQISNKFSFTLEIHEVKDVLKETLIDTKTNNVVTTGNFI
jgi:hypothetical protein